jgi:hypothetical protein
MVCIVCGELDRRVYRRWRKVPPDVHPRWWEQPSYIAREPATELIEEVHEQDPARRFCHQHWGRTDDGVLKPSRELRRRWWSETSYGAREPSPGLVEAIRTALTSGEGK